jgi:hypothetical protein
LENMIPAIWNQGVEKILPPSPPKTEMRD